MGTTEEARGPDGDRYDFVSLCLAEGRELEAVLRRARGPDLAGLAGWEWKGYLASELAIVAGLSKLKIGFYLEDRGRDPALGICGYDVPCHANTLGEPWIERTRRGEPLRLGWFDVYPVSLAARDNRYPKAVLLDHSTSPSALALDPLRTLRAYLAQVYPDEPDLLVGKAYVALGAARLWPTYLVLERHNEAAAP